MTVFGTSSEIFSSRSWHRRHIVTRLYYWSILVINSTRVTLLVIVVIESVKRRCLDGTSNWVRRNQTRRVVWAQWSTNTRYPMSVCSFVVVHSSTLRFNAQVFAFEALPHWHSLELDLSRDLSHRTVRSVYESFLYLPCRENRGMSLLGWRWSLLLFYLFQWMKIERNDRW